LFWQNAWLRPAPPLPLPPPDPLELEPLLAPPEDGPPPDGVVVAPEDPEELEELEPELVAEELVELPEAGALADVLVLGALVVMGAGDPVVPPAGTVRPVAGLVPVPAEPPLPHPAISPMSRTVAPTPVRLRVTCLRQITPRVRPSAEGDPSGDRSSDSR
jgi:hypothetical protein